MLLQVPGVSEEMAKIIAERYPSPGMVLSAIASTVDDSSRQHEPDARDAELFIADLEYLPS